MEVKIEAKLFGLSLTKDRHLVHGGITFNDTPYFPSAIEDDIASFLSLSDRTSARYLDRETLDVE